MPPIKGDDGVSGIPVVPPPGNFAVWGDSRVGNAVVGTTGGVGIGVYGQSGQPGVVEIGNVGVHGRGWGRDSFGVFGGGDPSNFSTGVLGIGNSFGVIGQTESGTGVFANSTAFGTGLLARSTSVALRAECRATGSKAILASQFAAAEFTGLVFINGRIFSFGAGFLIDHPLDPANKYIQHASVESAERKNIYDGIAVLNSKGEALVKLPEWFSVLNRDFRYQLTCLGGHAPVYLAQEIENNRFRIAGGSPGLKVSWLVTGIRHDPWAKANPLAPEAKKPEKERGSFLQPALYGQPEEKGLQQMRYPGKPEEQIPQALLDKLAPGREEA